MNSIEFKIAESGQDFDLGKALFVEYAGSLNFALAYQDFDKELATLTEQYREPDGALILCFHNGQAIGCVGVRRFSDDVAELKRLFVKPEFRNLKAGIKLIELSIEKARELKYKFLRLDTVPGQEKAQRLYRQLGFNEIDPYRYSPIDRTIYMEKALTD